MSTFYEEVEDTLLGAQAKKQRALIIQINNVPQLVAAQGEVASLAQQIVPDSIDAKVYETVGDQLLAGLKDKGVDATIKTVDVSKWALDEDDLGAFKFTAIGFASASVLGLIAYFMFRGTK